MLIPRTARAPSLQMDGCTQDLSMADSCAISRVSAKTYIQTYVCTPLTPTYHLSARGGVGRLCTANANAIMQHPRAELAGTRPKRR